MNETRIAYIEAYAADEYGDGPTYIRLDVTPDFKAQLRNLQRLVQDNGLSEARVYTGEATWGPKGIEDKLRLSHDEMVVTHDTFWFVSQPKYADYHVETRGQNIHDFLSLIEDGETGPVYEPKSLQELVEDDLATEESAAAT